MKVLVIYDSVFGNTEKIAQAIGAALVSLGSVGVIRVSDVQPGQMDGVGLMLVGSPTRGFRPTDAIKNFLLNLPADKLAGVKVAAFDTRIPTGNIKSPILRTFVKWGGYADKPIAEAMVKHGGSLLLPPEGFFVKDSEGPLVEGELERASTWARQAAEASGLK
ncbi:MAG TPA: flavodoxin family protein [Longilinea sp.]|nr:flavodoxin family protein [Longilinea sp.]